MVRFSRWSAIQTNHNVSMSSMANIASNVGLLCHVNHGRQLVFSIGGRQTRVVRLSCNGGPEILPQEILQNFICQTVHFGEYLCDNWSTECVHFALLNTEVILRRFYIHLYSPMNGRKNAKQKKKLYSNLNYP